MIDSHPKYPDDYQFVHLLLSGHTDAWDRFYKEFRKKIAIYINRKYPSIFNEVMIDEICDGVQNRLTKSNYKVLREYRGDCSFSSFVTKATDWEVKDWLRKYSDKLFAEPIDSDSTLGSDIYISTASLEYEEDIPEKIQSLSDDLRWAFLFRYYDYFGFPLNEIRQLAKKKRVHIASLTQKIIKFLEPEGEDILSTHREKQSKLNLKLQKICTQIQKLRLNEHKLSTIIEQHTICEQPEDKEIIKKLDIIRKELSKVDRKRKDLLKNNLCVPITTPYEIIAEILGEENVSTIRSRVFLAKKQLGDIIIKKADKTF